MENFVAARPTAARHAEFNTLVVAHRQSVWSYILKLIRDHHLADDLPAAEPQEQPLALEVLPPAQGALLGPSVLRVESDAFGSRVMRGVEHALRLGSRPERRILRLLDGKGRRPS